MFDDWVSAQILSQFLWLLFCSIRCGRFAEDIGSAVTSNGTAGVAPFA